MKISVLIVSREWIPKEANFDFLNILKDNKIDFEILIAEGQNPSAQRNALGNVATGDYFLFLDDDSLPISNLLDHYSKTIELYPDAHIIGGPSVLIKESNLISKLSNTFFSSVFGIGHVKCRYNSIGEIRTASEQDLILCNLLMERRFFLDSKGFNHALFPGEENEFLKRHQLIANIIYDPDAVVYRAPRSSLILFLKQMFSYGKGRAKHLNLKFYNEYLFFIPLIFTLYVLLLPALANFSIMFFIPILTHVLFSLCLLLTRENTFTYLEKLLLPWFFMSGHFCYGLGLLGGIGKYKILRKRLKSRSNLEEITIQHIKKFKKNHN